MKKLKGVPVTSRGQWDYPGQPTIVPTPTGKITMKGVPYPVMGTDETGHTEFMVPGEEYSFPGNVVYEKPVKGWMDNYQDGGSARPADLPPMTENAGPVNQWLYDKGVQRQKRLQSEYDVREAADKELKYVRSAKYADLLSAEFYGPDKTYDDLSESEKVVIDQVLDNRRQNLQDINLVTADLSKKGIKAGYDPNFHTMFVPETPVERGVFPHEFSHVGDQSEFKEGTNPGVGPYFTEQLNQSVLPKNNAEYLNQPSTLKRDKTIGENKEEDFSEADYLQDPSEIKARLRALRDSSIDQGYKLMEPGYDINKYKKGFSAEEQKQYEQLKKAGLSDEKINELMYLFAANNASHQEVACMGGESGWLNKYQEGGEQSTEDNPDRLNAINVSVDRTPWYKRLPRQIGDRIGLDPYFRDDDDFWSQWRERLVNATGGKEWYKKPNSVLTGIMSTAVPLDVPQLAAVYAVTGKAETPAEAMDIENPVLAAATNMMLDPIGGPALMKGALKGASAAGKALTTSTPLKNAYKLNPNALSKLGEYTRVVGQDAIDDLAESGVVRSGAGAVDNTGFARPTAYPSFGKGAPKQTYVNEVVRRGDQPFVLSTDRPMGVSTLGRHGKGSTMFPVDEAGNYMRSFPASEVEVFHAEPHWLKGYKKADIKPSFRSEIDWGKWNPDTPKYPELMEEYHNIEKSAKEAGTWMKNPDGSAFKGSPEQFVQQQSTHFKKAYPEGYDMTYRGVGITNNNPDFSQANVENLHGDRGIFTANRELAEYYAPGDKGILTPFSKSDQTGLYELLHPKGKQIDYNTDLADWTDINLAKGGSKLQLQLNYDSVKKHLENLKKLDDIDPLLLERQEERLKDLQQYIDDFDKTVTDPEAMKQLRATLGDVTSTDDIAAYLPETDLRKIHLRNIIDGDLGDVTIVNSRPGNYMKSNVGNVGFFDLNNPNIFKSLVPAGVGIGQMLSGKKENWLDKYQ